MSNQADKPIHLFPLFQDITSSSEQSDEGSTTMSIRTPSLYTSKSQLTLKKTASQNTDQDTNSAELAEWAQVRYPDQDSEISFDIPNQGESIVLPPAAEPQSRPAVITSTPAAPSAPLVVDGEIDS